MLFKNKNILSLLYKKTPRLQSKKNRIHSNTIMKMPVPNIKNVGRQTYYNKNLYIDNPNTIIGSFCSIGADVTIGHGIHPLNFLSTSPYLYFNILGFKKKKMVSHDEYWETEPIQIGNDVWIGDGVFIKNGIIIGDGAIIGAKAVVTKDVPPYAIVAGIPAKIIKYRFNKSIIKKLLQLKWWNLDEKIIKNIPYDNIDKAINFLENHKI